jgi:quercetin dioxygenase-like cupin family protein
MNREQFLQSLKEMGYPEPVEVFQPANGSLGNHTHSFAVQALVLDGHIEIDIAGKVKKYAAGDVFQLAHEELHAENYGPQGVHYLASRKNS